MNGTGRRCFRTMATVLLAALLVSCGGIRRGWYSRPYLEGGRIPEGQPSTFGEYFETLQVTLPGIELRLSMNNQVQTSSTEYIGIVVPMLPVGLDLKTRDSGTVQPGRHTVDITLSPQQEGHRFAPHQVLLVIDGVPAKPTEAARMHSTLAGRERELWPPAGGSLPLPLAAKGGGTTFQLVFPVERPSPDQEIWVDLGEALSSAAGKPGPRIGFRKTRWSNPYS